MWTEKKPFMLKLTAELLESESCIFFLRGKTQKRWWWRGLAKDFEEQVTAHLKVSVTCSSSALQNIVGNDLCQWFCINYWTEQREASFFHATLCCSQGGSRMWHREVILQLQGGWGVGHKNSSLKIAQGKQGVGKKESSIHIGTVP